MPCLCFGRKAAKETQLSKPEQPIVNVPTLILQDVRSTVENDSEDLKPADARLSRAPCDEIHEISDGLVEESREGLIQLKGFEDNSGPTRRVDVVAIHGLNGHPIKTWKEGDVIWFAKFLPPALPEFDLRISTFGYNSQILGGGTILRVRDFATQMLGSLSALRSETNTERVPLLFICHSLGGIVFKKMLTIAHERQGLYNDIKVATKGVIFFGTPHCGSDVANTSRVIRDIFSFCTAGSFRADLLRNLERSSDELVEIAAQFVERAIRLQIVTVYEGRPLGSAVGPVVVNKASAVMNLPNERLIPIDADHRSICRFSSQEDSRFESILPTIGKLLRESVAEEDSEIQACLDTLHFHAYKERRNNVSPAHVSTFTWIWDHPKYQLWEDLRSSSLVWLQGKPGSGKSTLANFVRSRVKNRVGLQSGRQTIVVDFFYSARGGSLQNQHYWMLRSLLYQFLLQVPGLWGSYRENFRECRMIEKSDAWRIEINKDHRDNVDGSELPQLWSLSKLTSLFEELGSVHTPGLRVTAYVIVDALDESEERGRQPIIELLRRASKKDPSWPIAFKIFLSSRPSPKIEHTLRGCHSIVLEDETSADIVNFVNAETKRIAEEVLERNHEELSFISSYLIKASNGVFLWVKLVLNQLDQRATEGFCSVVELEQLLLSIPRDLGDLYRLILQKIMKGSRNDVLECQTVFRWIAYSPTPLQTDQMLEVVAAKMCSNSGPITRATLQRHRVGNTEVMRRRLISLCGNLVEVKGKIVQFIHTTVREFLLEETCAPPISLARGESLAEIAELCAGYVDGFRHVLQQDTWLIKMNQGDAKEEWDESKCNTTVYTGLIDEFKILRYLYKYEIAYQTDLDRELCARSHGQSLRVVMSSAWQSLKPVVLEAVARADTTSLGALILEPDQINELYPIPQQDARFDQNLIHSPIVGHTTKHLGLLHLVSLLPGPERLDVLDLLHKHGADPNYLDDSGSTALHMAVRIGALARTQCEEVVEDLVALRLHSKFITPDSENLFQTYNVIFNILSEPIAGHSRRSRSVRQDRETILKASMLLSAAMREGYDLFRQESSGLKISRQQVQHAASRVRPPLEPSDILPRAVWSVLWALASAQKRLIELLMQLITGGIEADKHYASRSVLPLLDNAIQQLHQDRSLVDGGVKAKTLIPNKFLSACSLIDGARSLVSRLLDHRADPTIPDKAMATPLSVALNSGLFNTVALLLNSIKRNAEFELALVKSKREKLELLHRAGTLVARLLYDECATLESDHIMRWLWFEHTSNSDFIFNPASVDLLNLSEDKNHCSAMHLAASRGNAVAIAKMLAFGFSKDTTDGQGRTAKDIAFELGRGKVILTFKEHEVAEAAASKHYTIVKYQATWSWVGTRYIFSVN
ncbi:hypothetical protein EG329_013310 [Mollisiaceae sp. DMI_Dod_QoI]|nr:hypothetical protein EG329_013310 [Helotiales sp. DMI_Dod_QoI]